jgi:hypothetical protein
MHWLFGGKLGTGQSYLEGSNKTLWLGYADGTTEGLPSLLRELRLLANREGYLAVGGIFPLCDRVLQSLTLAGYQRVEERSRLTGSS